MWTDRTIHHSYRCGQLSFLTTVIILSPPRDCGWSHTPTQGVWRVVLVVLQVPGKRRSCTPSRQLASRTPSRERAAPASWTAAAATAPSKPRAAPTASSGPTARTTSPTAALFPSRSSTRENGAPRVATRRAHWWTCTTTMPVERSASTTFTIIPFPLYRSTSSSSTYPSLLKLAHCFVL